MIGIDRMTDPAQIHRAILRATRQGDFAIAEIQRVTQRSETLRRESDTITAKPLRDITPADVERIIQITREVERLLARNRRAQAMLTAATERLKQIQKEHTHG